MAPVLCGDGRMVLLMLVPYALLLPLLNSSVCFLFNFTLVRETYKAGAVMEDLSSFLA